MNKKDKIERCRQILYKYGLGDVITNSDDIDFLLSLTKK